MLGYLYKIVVRQILCKQFQYENADQGQSLTIKKVAKLYKWILYNLFYLFSISTHTRVCMYIYIYILTGRLSSSATEMIIGSLETIHINHLYKIVVYKTTILYKCLNKNSNVARAWVSWKKKKKFSPCPRK